MALRSRLISTIWTTRDGDLTHSCACSSIDSSRPRCSAMGATCSTKLGINSFKQRISWIRSTSSPRASSNRVSIKPLMSSSLRSVLRCNKSKEPLKTAIGVRSSWLASRVKIRSRSIKVSRRSAKLSMASIITSTSTFASARRSPRSTAGWL